MVTNARTGEEVPLAWVGCLGCYNAGLLIGSWVDGDEAGAVTVNELHQQSEEAVLRADPYASSHEELWVMDHQGYSGMLSGECSPSEAQHVAEAIEDLQQQGLPAAAFAAYAANVGRDHADLEGFLEAYAGCWPSEAEFAQDWAIESGQISEDAALFSYIDWDGVWRGEYDCAGWYSAKAAEGLYIFRPV